MTDQADNAQAAPITMDEVLDQLDALNAEYCECSEEYGPCEQHSTQLAQREGASTRTADALALVFLEDVRDILAAVVDDPDAARAVEWLTAEIGYAYTWEWSGPHAGDGWLETPNDDSYSSSEYLQDLVQRAESDLGMIGASVWWDDGYVILTMSDDCPLNLENTVADEMDAAREAYEQAAQEYRG